MKINSLLVSNLHINEDEYSYKGLFTLSLEDISMQVDLSDLDQDQKLEEIKKTFILEEPSTEIRKFIMDRVIQQSGLSSPTSEGENYSEGKRKKNTEHSASSLDRA